MGVSKISEYSKSFFLPSKIINISKKIVLWRKNWKFFKILNFLCLKISKFSKKISSFKNHFDEKIVLKKIEKIKKKSENGNFSVDFDENFFDVRRHGATRALRAYWCQNFIKKSLFFFKKNRFLKIKWKFKNFYFAFLRKF